MPPGKMQGFVNNRAGSPSRPQSANSNRIRVAGQAKMQVPPTSLRNQPAEQHTALRRHPGNQHIHTAGQLQGGQRRESGETLDGRRDRYGTDAGSSIDTTINEHSMIEGERAQLFRQQQFTHDAGQDEDGEFPDEAVQSGIEQSNEEDESDDEEEEEEEEEEEVGRGHVAYLDEAGEEIARHGVFEGNSYPSTTSGPPDEPFNQLSARQHLSADRVEYEDQGVWYPKQAARGNPTHSFPPPPTRTNNPAAGSLATPGTNLFEKSAAVRKSQQRANLATNVPGAVFQTSASQAPSYSQVVPPPSLPAKAAQGQKAPAVASQDLQYGVRLRSPSPHTQPTRQPTMATTGPVLAVRSAQPQAQSSLEEEQADLYRSIERDSDHDVEGPIGDYDTADLVNLSYDQLRDEDFDYEPRGKNEVLSKDMQHRDLPERLSYVQKNVGAGDKEKFFRALPTREWEDAGDWFLEQFGSIIHRAKEARQNKRKVARDFEDEVEQRYRRVAKRQQNVAAALDEMKRKGQGLIPKSPRSSKEPVSKTPRSRKR